MKEALISENELELKKGELHDVQENLRDTTQQKEQVLSQFNDLKAEQEKLQEQLQSIRYQTLELV